MAVGARRSGHEWCQAHYNVSVCVTPSSGPARGATDVPTPADCHPAIARRGRNEQRGHGLSEYDGDDVALVARLAGGDEAVLGVLYDRYGRAVYSLAMRIVHDTGMAEDVTQEVFIRLWRAAGRFDPSKGKLHSWLLRITHNLALNEIRSQSNHRASAATFDWELDAGELADSDVGVDPAAMAWLRERAELVRRALAQLSPAQRQAIEMAFFGGQSQTEIAASLGEPLGTVKSRIRSGMQRLAEVLRSEGVTT